MVQISSAVVDAIAQYSDSVLDPATVGCFLALQEIQFAPRKIQYPVVDHRVKEDLAQSASEKPYKSKNYFVKYECQN